MRTGQDSLDDPEAVRAADPGGMLDLVASLGDQLARGYRAGAGAENLPSAVGIHSLAICGMGGSGFAGDVVHALFAARLPFPLAVVKGYVLPEFCGRDTVVLAVSFSGDTEETVAGYTEAVGRGCRVVVVSKGGRLSELARSDQVAHVPLPPDAPPVPRGALGYLAGSVIGVLDALGVVPTAADDVERGSELLDALASELAPAQPEDRNEAKRMARWLHGRTPIVWGSEGPAAAAALRWKNQLNENAKVPAFFNVIPELDHNEIEAWSADGGQAHAAVLLRYRGEHPRNALRAAPTAEAAAASGLEVREVWARGTNPYEWLFSLVMLGDFVSAYLALIRGVDPTPIPVLTELKERLPE